MVKTLTRSRRWLLYDVIFCWGNNLLRVITEFPKIFKPTRNFIIIAPLTVGISFDLEDLFFPYYTKSISHW